MPYAPPTRATSSARPTRESRVFNVIAILDKQSREDVARVAELPLRTRAGNFVLLRQIADVFQVAGRYQVDHSRRPSACRAV